MSAADGVQGITEADIANYLVHNPAFFERHAELLATIQIRSPHGARAVSLQERQMEMLRERIRGLEAKIVEMLRAGQDNGAIAARLHDWVCAVLATTPDAALPAVVVDVLAERFMVPQAALRLWGLDAVHAALPAAVPVSDDVRRFAASLAQPYCGMNSGFEAVGWLDEAARVMSVALVPLRRGTQVFGLLVLGSPDPTRYRADLGTEFLARLGEVAAAALARLLPRP